MKLTLAAGNGFRQHLMYKLDTRCTYCKILPLTGVLSQLRVMLHDWAARPVRDDCYSWAAVSLIDSKTLWQRNFSLGRRQVLQSLGVIVGLSLKNCTPILSTMPKYKLLDCLLAHAKCLCASQCRKAEFSKLSPMCKKRSVRLGIAPALVFNNCAIGRLAACASKKNRGANEADRDFPLLSLRLDRSQ